MSSTSVFTKFAAGLAGAALLSAAFSAQARELSISTVLSDAFPWGQAAEKWAELVEERSEGRLTMRVYPNAQLVAGDQTREFSAMRSGLIDAAVGSTINWSPQVPELNLFSLPFLLPDEAAVDAVTGGAAGETIFAAIESRDVVPLAWGENGFRQLSNSRGAIAAPEDLEGLKIRVVGSPLFQDTFSALGADPTQMSWTDAQPALTTGAVDGQENPLSVFDVARIDQVGQEHLTLWNYMNDPLIFAVNRRVWESLDEADREILREAAVDAGEWEIAMTREQEAERLAAIRERGVEVTELNEAQYQAFVEATESVHQEWVPQIGEALVEAARQAVEAR
ncbi:DctP family TRAP transporter solute-binding subunit [Halomonas pacifica]|uniref:C4-dicarboxylate ABC transporter n=1 Tax=Bisbaumannia pacifica TaxID=77098 RepID=A0A510X5Q2_9GAMM|nr:DctP family TRAP transporter solute-binding subunit [Halomonas pacifica]MBH8579193.1 DctP family TRAP transporter solute-binding subunit [Halomonas pacifica]MDC8802052.1 DctP family TRAP transporter solute-binding subunit [Halomonas pacifica]GEK46742.1 C4-dicarboxylate ABC transporter [Halomonas pacifica]